MAFGDDALYRKSSDSALLDAIMPWLDEIDDGARIGSKAAATAAEMRDDLIIGLDQPTIFDGEKQEPPEDLCSNKGMFQELSIARSL